MLAIALFYVGTRILVELYVKYGPKTEIKASILTELDEIVFDDKKIRLIFFYEKDSELCGMMRYNIEQISKKKLEGIVIYTMDVEKHPEYFTNTMYRGLQTS